MKYFKKMINNNVALVEDEVGNEFIAIGKGIAFQKKTGDLIDKNLIEKEYTQKNASRLGLINYLKDVDYQVFSVCDQVRDLIQRTYNIDYSDFMYLSLIDHINGTISRIKLDIHIKSEISSEDLKFYSKEVWLADETNKLVQAELGLTFDENELSFLILHFIGILYDLKYSNINERAISVSNDILDIIVDTIDDVDEKSFAIERLMIHLRYFVIRQINKSTKQEPIASYNEELYSFLITKDPEAEKILLKVIKYLESEHEFKVSLDEWLYLLIHITKIIK